MSAQRRRHQHPRRVPGEPPPGFRTMPGFVATCHWRMPNLEACGAPTKLGLKNIGLHVPPDLETVYVLKVVPLCPEHLTEYAFTKSVKLPYHPVEAIERGG